MQRIPIKLATAGMKLAKPVRNKRGMILCGSNVELTEEMIARLSHMGVERITVEGHPVDTGVEEKSPAQQIDEVSARFRHVEKDPLMRKIRDAIIQRLKEKGELGESG